MMGIADRGKETVTEEEVKFAIAEGTEAGVIDEVEEEMIHGVLELADRSVASIMTPRPDVYWDRPRRRARHGGARRRRMSLFAHRGGARRRHEPPDGRGAEEGSGRGPDPRQRRAHGDASALSPRMCRKASRRCGCLQIFRTTPLHIVFDEYGDFQGLVTLTDIMTAVVVNSPRSTSSRRRNCSSATTARG